MLLWGVLAAGVMRASLIAVGVTLVQLFHWSCTSSVSSRCTRAGWVTPLLLVLVAVESTDPMFTIDSVPEVLFRKSTACARTIRPQSAA